MAIFAAPAAVGLAGKLLPFLAKAGSAAKLPMVLRTAGILGGAAPGLMRGDLGSAVTGGALGAVGTLGMGGAAKGLSGAAAKKIFAEGTKRGLSNQAIAQLQGVAQAGIPIAGGLALGRLAGGGLGGGAGNVG